MTDSGWTPAAPASADPYAVAESTSAAVAPRRHVLATLGGVLAAGVTTQAITWDEPLGLSWLVLVVLLVGASFALHGRRPRSLAIAWAGATVWLAGAFVLHASQWATVTALPASALMLLALPALLARRWGWGDLGRLPLLGWAVARELPAASWEGARLPARTVDATTRAGARNVLYGVLLGLPVTLIFVVLLSADARFAEALGELLSASVRGVDFAAWSAGTAAIYLALHLAYVRLRPPRAERPAGTDAQAGPYRTPAPADRDAQAGRAWCIRPVTWAVVLAQLLSVFGLFVAVNGGELFAGHETAQASGTYTYAEHLHAGFAQLSIATLLVVVTVVAGHWGLRGWRRAGAGERVPGGRWVIALEVGLVLLAAITLASCWQRLHIYQEAYGYTYLRLGVALCQVAVLGLLVLTAVKSLARRWRAFPAAVTVLGLGLGLVMGSLDTDEMLARWNIQRAARPLVEGAAEGYDVAYLRTLSDDALPALGEPALDRAPLIEQDLREQWTAERERRREHGWRAMRGLGAP